jgi:hypothetical protein
MSPMIAKTDAKSLLVADFAAFFSGIPSYIVSSWLRFRHNRLVKSYSTDQAVLVYKLAVPLSQIHRSHRA